MMLSYPFTLAPLFIVVGVMALLTSYLALIALAIGAILVLGLVVFLAWAAAAGFYGVARRRLRQLTRDRSKVVSDSDRDHVYS